MAFYTIKKDVVKMKKYVCFLEQDHWSSLNSLWAVIRERDFIPDSILVLSRKKNSENFSRNVRSLISAYGGDVKLEVEHTMRPSTARKAISRFMSEGNSESTVLDISGGCKEFVVGVLIDGFNESFDHVFYLSSEMPIHSPYPVLDHAKFCLKDLLEG